MTAAPHSDRGAVVVPRCPTSGDTPSGGVTYEEVLDDLRDQWRRHPHRRDTILCRARQTEREQENALLVAVHETGHAVVAHALGYTIACLSRATREDGSCAGHVRLADKYVSPLDAAVIAAGGYALSVIAGVADPDRGCATDRLLVERAGADWDEAVGYAQDRLRLWEPQAKLLVATLRHQPVLHAEQLRNAMRGAYL